VAAPAPEADPSKRACPSCSAQNPLSAGFCWQCLRPLGAGVGAARSPYDAPTPTGPFGPPGSPATGTDFRQSITNRFDTQVPMPSSKPKDPLMSALRMVIPLLVVLGAAYFGWRLFFAGVGFPDSLAGQPRIEHEALDQVFGDLEGMLEQNGAKAEVAMYGNPAGPNIIIGAAVRGGPAKETRDAFSLLTAFPSLGGALNPRDVEQHVQNGVTFYCARGETPSCLWLIDDGFAFIGSPTYDLTSVLAMAAEAQRAMQG
jgi:hypothetical protein